MPEPSKSKALSTGKGLTTWLAGYSQLGGLENIWPAIRRELKCGTTATYDFNPSYAAFPMFNAAYVNYNLLIIFFCNRRVQHLEEHIRFVILTLPGKVKIILV